MIFTIQGVVAKACPLLQSVFNTFIWDVYVVVVIKNFPFSKLAQVATQVLERAAVVVISSELAQVVTGVLERAAVVVISSELAQVVTGVLERAAVVVIGSELAQVVTGVLERAAVVVAGVSERISKIEVCEYHF